MRKRDSEKGLFYGPLILNRQEINRSELIRPRIEPVRPLNRTVQILELFPIDYILELFFSF